MRTIALTEFGTQPTLVDIPTPQPGPDEVLVRVKAASINGFDVSAASGYLEGMMEHRFPVVLGKDFAGTIEAVGSNAAGFTVGDRVFGVVNKDFLGDGSFGEFVTVPVAAGLAHLPEGISLEQGGALGLAGTTARQAVDALNLTPGQTVLVAGATGGVGTLAVQLAKQAGAHVIATAHGDEAEHLLSELGADELIDYTQDVAAQVLTAHPEGVDAVLHLAGDSASLLPVIRAGGNLASTLIMSPEQIPSDTVTVKAVYANPDADVLNELAAAVAGDQLKLPIERSYTLEQVPQALLDFPNGTLGKTVISII